jgi:hypothetical protein
MINSNGVTDGKQQCNAIQMQSRAEQSKAMQCNCKKQTKAKQQK